MLSLLGDFLLETYFFQNGLYIIALKWFENRELQHTSLSPKDYQANP